jgi:hypothetical protein
MHTAWHRFILPPPALANTVCAKNIVQKSCIIEPLSSHSGGFGADIAYFLKISTGNLKTDNGDGTHKLSFQS